MKYPSNAAPFSRLKAALVVLPVLIASPLPSVAATLPVSSAAPAETQLAQAAITETVLYFETNSMAVRIYRQGNDLFMNLYNKKSGLVEVRDTPAELVPSTRNQTVYRNSLGDVDRLASVNLLGESELKIVGPDGTTSLQESGAGTVVGIPSGATDFQGNNFAPGTSAIVIAARFANLRQGPEAESSVLTSAPRRDTVDVLDRVGNPRDGFIWYKVLYSGQTGWIRGDLLQPA